MNYRSSLVACACSLAFAAAPAWADDSAKISQGGVSNTATIEQIATAGNNMASVHQGDGWYYSGSGNNAQLLQRGVDNSRIDVMQSGFNNIYRVEQSDGSNLQATINMNAGMYGDMGGEGNMVQIFQSGGNAIASVEQGGSMYSRAEIMQHGWGGQNAADITQQGTNNQGNVFQYGGDNRGSIYQSGNNLNASISQQSSGYGYGYGYGNNAVIRQGY